MRPDWRSYRLAVTTTLAWGAFTFIFNTIAGTDYGFPNGKPLHASFLDLLEPWPFYVPEEVLIVGVVWALMTWPWELKRRRQLIRIEGKVDFIAGAARGQGRSHTVSAPTCPVERSVPL